MRHVLIALVAALALAACGGGDGSAARTPPGSAAGPVAGVPADGGLSIAEAKTSALEGPLAVGGYLVAEGDSVRLCDALSESMPPRCGGESLAVEGVDLEMFDTRTEGEVTWTDARVSLVGEVEGDTLRVSQTSM